MRIDIETLANVTRETFEYLKAAGVDFVDVEEDFYWHIKAPERNNPYKRPEELDLGQLSDDWHEVQRIANGEAAPMGYALVWLAALFEAFGEKCGR